MATLSSPILVDGSYGEGGGALIRTAACMSALTQQPLRVSNVRGGTPYPGLDVEDVILLQALSKSTSAETVGMEPGSAEFSFLPTARPKGLSVSLEALVPEGQRGPNALVVLNSLLPVLARTGMYSSITAEGETFGHKALSFDYFSNVTLHAYRKMGLWSVADLLRAGFGRESRGRVALEVEPSVVNGFKWEDRGQLLELRATITYSGLPGSVGGRAISHLERLCSHAGLKIEADMIEASSKTPGCFVTMWAQYERGLGGSTAMGQRGVKVESLVQRVFDEMMDWMKSKATLDENLADQVLLAATLSEEGASFTVPRLTQRFLTCVWVIKQFLPILILVKGSEGTAGSVTIKR